MHGRQPGDDGGDDNIKEMLRVLLKKLDKAADDDLTGVDDVTAVDERRAYNISHIQLENENKNTHNAIVGRILLLLSYLFYTNLFIINLNKKLIYPNRSRLTSYNILFGGISQLLTHEIRRSDHSYIQYAAFLIYRQ